MAVTKTFGDNVSEQNFLKVGKNREIIESIKQGSEGKDELLKKFRALAETYEKVRKLMGQPNNDIEAEDDKVRDLGRDALNAELSQKIEMTRRAFIQEETSRRADENALKEFYGEKTVWGNLDEKELFQNLKNSVGLDKEAIMRISAGCLRAFDEGVGEEQLAKIVLEGMEGERLSEYSLMMAALKSKGFDYTQILAMVMMHARSNFFKEVAEKEENEQFKERLERCANVYLNAIGALFVINSMGAEVAKEANELFEDNVGTLKKE